MTDAQPTKGHRKRADNEGTKLPDGRWQTRATYDDGGQQRRKAFYGKTQAKAKEKRDQFLKDRDSGLDPDATKITVGAYLDWWITERKMDVDLDKLRPATLESYRGHIKNHIKPAIGATKLRALTVRQVNVLLDAIVKNGGSPGTANRVRATLRAALADAEKDGKVPRNVAKYADAQKEHHADVNPPSVGQLRRFFDLTAFHSLGPLFVVAAHTGLRQGELLALTWDDVDLDAGVLHVRTTASIGKDGKRSRNAPKTAKSAAAVGLTPQAIRALQTQRARIEQLELKAAERWHDNGLVFPSTVGTLQNPANVTHRFQELLRTSGFVPVTHDGREGFVSATGLKPQQETRAVVAVETLDLRAGPDLASPVVATLAQGAEVAITGELTNGFPRWRFHDLRHATASILLANGANLAEVQKVLRHSSYTLTANLYTHLTPELRERNVDRMASAFGFDATDDATGTKSGKIRN